VVARGQRTNGSADEELTTGTGESSEEGNSTKTNLPVHHKKHENGTITGRVGLHTTGDFLNIDPSEIVEDATCDELAVKGHTEKLPPNVRNIRTCYYFDADPQQTLQQPKHCVLVKGETKGSLTKNLGL
jgi:hypothetical protein